ncbi:ABC transporter ATP-binding protein [Parasulfuritortus cantonensis]|nr:ABC transporter ATP-binding protein [Parasulfuritortus cantonensis]
MIKVEGVSKKFCRNLKRSLWYGMSDLAGELVGRRHGGDGGLRRDEFWAIKDVSFEVKRGEALGLIGHNGAGKTTLLRLLNGLIKPDAGRVEVRGRVGALIALGAGFNPILSGRENIYINASVLGLSKREIDSKLDAIIDFSEIEDFIDAPVQSYSSGMHVRLGFSIAIHLSPDVMLVDEALAVGDARFQKKCFDRIQKLQGQGTAFIVVSHNPYQIESLCQKVGVMHKGCMPPVCDGKQALNLYHDLVQQSLPPLGRSKTDYREGTGVLRFESLRVVDANGQEPNVVNTSDTICIVADINAEQRLSGLRFRFEICSANNAIVIMATANGVSESQIFEGKRSVSFTMSPCQLTSGWYYINAVASDGKVRLDTWQRALEFRVTQRDGPGRNLSTDQGVFVCNGHWDFMSCI